MELVPPSDWQLTARRCCIAIAAVSVMWIYIVVVTGGFVVNAGVIHFSSRSPRNPIILLAIAAAVGSTLARGGGSQRSMLADVSWLSAVSKRWLPVTVRRWAAPSTLAASAVVATVAVGVIFGAHVAGGSDSFGYVSQARLWAAGKMNIEQPLLDDLPARVPQEALVPLAYRLSPDRRSLVPVYAPGFPMTMALFDLVGGHRAVFLVMPLLAGLLVWATYELGRPLIGNIGAAAAALLLLSSPSFLFQLLRAPMSDIPAAAWWAVALLFATRSGGTNALIAGIAGGAAVLTRPNLAPIAAVLGTFFLLRCQSRNRTVAIRDLMLFSVPVGIGGLVIALLNLNWYGSPFESGYGPLTGGLFRWQYFWPNMGNFTRWLFESEGPFVALSALGAISLWMSAPHIGDRRVRVALLAGVALVTVACYAFYLPLDAWWSLRFLFPAFPAIAVFMVAGAQAIAGRLPLDWRNAVPIALLAAVTMHAIPYARANGALNSKDELRFEQVGRYIAANTSSRAAMLSMMHSGSIRLYADRLTVRYDLIAPEDLANVIARLAQLGYTPYLVVDVAEDKEFRNRFKGTPSLADLDEPLNISGVFIYRFQGPTGFGGPS